MEIKPYGDRALLINFRQSINPEVLKQVLKYYEHINTLDFPAIQSIIPSYCSLCIYYDPSIISYEALEKVIASLKIEEIPLFESRQITVPVCFSREYALDMRTISSRLKLTRKEIITTFCNRLYQVYNLGFLPGFPYLGKIDKKLDCPRKKKPRLKVPAQSVAIAGRQAGIYPSSTPGGWNIIGRTPIKIFHLKRNEPFFFQIGDQVKFEPISRTEFLRWNQDNIITYPDHYVN